MSASRLVSVVMPVYNAAAYLETAIRSVMAQTHADVELLAVDDGSTDASRDLLDDLAAREPRLRVFHGENAGPSAARNVALAAANGAYVAFLDADDWFLPEKLNVQIAALEARPDVDLVYSDYREHDDATGREHDVARGVPPVTMAELLVYRPWFAPMAPLLRRRLVDRVGFFDASLRAAEDWDYWYRCVHHTEFLYAPAVVGVYRLHGTQATKDRERMRRAHLRFAQKHFAGDLRRRRSSLAYFHLSEAKHAKGRGDLPAVAAHLARYVLNLHSWREARLVWRLP
jgi:glycosyltransferase involved in cell wall biosynthesis